MKIITLIASLGLLCSNIGFAHEGHEHEGLSKAETAKQVREGKLCILNNQGNSEGAIIEKEGKMYRCVKAYGQNLKPQTELVWVEVMIKDKALVTVP